MKRKKNILIQKYMKWTVKSPVTIVTLIILGLGSLIFMACITESNVYKTYEGLLVRNLDGTMYIEAKLDESLLGQSVYWYVDKEESIFKTSDFDVNTKDYSQTLTVQIKDEYRSILTSNETVYVDIVVDKVTIFSRIVSRGELNGN